MRKELCCSEIVESCKRLYAKNLLASADGNVSVRLSDSEILITPSGVAKAFMPPESMSVLNLKGEALVGKPSSESLMHLSVYRACPEAKAVVHAHPPTAIAYTIANPMNKFIPNRCFSELILAMGDLPIVPYARPGTQQMGDVLLEFLPKYRAMVLARHGGLCWGESLDEAIGGMERVEHICQILLAAQAFGGITELSEDEILYLYNARKSIGPKLL